MNRDPARQPEPDVGTAVGAEQPALPPAWADPNEVYVDLPQPALEHTGWEYYVERNTPPYRPWPETLPDHDRLGGLAGRLLLVTTARTPLFIGSGDYETHHQRDLRNMSIALVYQPFVNRGGAPVVPGTSIKGAVRSYAEALSPACEECRCGRCLPCRVFGTLGDAGRVTVLDTGPLSTNALDVRAIKVRFGRNNADRGGRRFYFHDEPERWQPPARDPAQGEWVQALKPGTEIEVELRFHNLTTAALGLVCLALGLATQWPFDLKLGGGKNRGLGSVRFQLRPGPDSLLAQDFAEPAARYRAWEPGGSAGGVDGYVDAYRVALGEQDWSRVTRSIERFRSSRPIAARPEEAR